MQSLKAQVQAQYIDTIIAITKKVRNGGIREVEKTMLPSFLNLNLFDDSQKLVQAVIPLRQSLKINIAKIKESPQKVIDQSLLFQCHFSLALVLQFLNDRSAKLHYQYAFDIFPNHPLLCLSIAFFLFKKQEPQQAINYLQKINLQAVINLYKQGFKSIFMIRLSKIDSNFIFETQYGSKGVLLKQFYVKALELAAEFYITAIRGEERNNYQYYINLTKILMKLNRRDQVLKWMEIITEINTTEYQIIAYVGELFTSLKMFKQSLPYLKKAIAISPRQDLYQQLIYILIELNQYEQAKQYIDKLIKINKHNTQAYKHMGFILSEGGKDNEAIECYLKSLSISNKDAYTYQNLGYSLIKAGRIMEAIQCYFLSIYISPKSLTCNQLASCFQMLGQLLNAIKFYKKSILLNYKQLSPYIVLSNYSQQNDMLKGQINKFMEQLKRNNPQNMHVQFIVVLYYYLSKQSYRQFHQIIIQFLKEEKENTDNSYSAIIQDTLNQYEKFTQSFRKKNLIFSLIIGILSRAKGNNVQAYRCYANLFKIYEIEQKQTRVQVFVQIYQKLLSKEAVLSSFLFLQFIIIQMLSQSPYLALMCYFKALNYCQYDYNEFKNELRNKIKQEVERIDEMQEIMYNVKQQEPFRTEVNNSYQDQKRIIIPNILQIKMDNMKQIIIKFQKCAQDQTLRITPKESILEDALIGINWKRQIPKQYRNICLQINQQEQNILKSIIICAQIYQKMDDQRMGLKIIVSLLQNFFEREFAINQIIKLIFNSLFPFIITDSEYIYRQFAFILDNLKNNHSYDFQTLKRNINQLFQQRKQIDQDFDKQSEIDSIFQFETNVEPLGRIISIRTDTQSQTNAFEDQSQFFKIDNIKKEKHRKYSDSNIAELTAQKYDKFINQITTKDKQSKVLKLIFVPFEQSQFNQSVSSSFQSQQQQGYEDNQSQVSFIIINNQQSNFQQNSSQFDNLRKFSLKYSINDSKFTHKRLYLAFNKLLFKNTYFIIKYISSNNYKHHIAKHYLKQSLTKQTHQFEAQVERGDEVNYPYFCSGLQEKTLKWIWMMGIEYVFQWIIDIAIGITQLEQLGIYHAQLVLRNTIRVSRNGWCAFKIIDFDKAFKVINTEQNDKAYQCTKDLIDYWLKFHFDERGSRAPFDFISHFSSYQSQGQSFSSRSSYYNQAEIIKYIFCDADQSLIQELLHIKNNAKFSPQRLPKCLHLLKNYMQLSHLKQYCSLVRKLLCDDYQTFWKQYWRRQQPKQRLTNQILNQILQYLSRLEQDGDYQSFAQRIKRFTNKNYSYDYL